MLSLKVSEGYAPPYDIDESTARNEYVLEIGNCAYLLDRKYHHDINRAKGMLNMSEVKERHEQEIKQLQEELNKIKLQNNLLSETIHKQYKEELNKIKEEHNNKISELKSEAKARFDDRESYLLLCLEVQTGDHKDLRERYEKHIKEITEQNNSRMNLLNQLVIDETTNHNKTLIRKDNEITELRNKLNDEINEMKNRINNEFKERESQYIETINVERKRVNALTERLADQSQKKNISCAEIGIVGEETIEQWIREIYPSADISNKSQESSKGDYHIKISNKVFLIEVKNKKAIVNTDINKFIRDIEENANDIHAGLFITINTSGIPNKGDFSLEYINNIPVIYLYVPDKQTLGVAIKTLNYLNTKADNDVLTILINNIYTTTKTISNISSAISKNNEDCKSNIDSLKREIKTQLGVLDKLFSESPELKIETSTHEFEYTPEEIKVLNEVYSINKKAKLEDYYKALGRTLKYLQDRGGASKIKTIVQPRSQPPIIFKPSIPLPTFNIPPPVLQIN